jgi:hypothetical protein
VSGRDSTKHPLGTTGEGGVDLALPHSAAHCRTSNSISNDSRDVIESIRFLLPFAFTLSELQMLLLSDL